jgi:hypothetical protein
VFQSLIGFWVVFGLKGLITGNIFPWFQSLIGFWVVFGSVSLFTALFKQHVSIPNRVLGGFRVPGSGWLEI